MKALITSLLAIVLWLSPQLMLAQSRTKAAVLSIPTKDLLTDGETLGNLVRMELQKTNRFEVIDQFDMVDLLRESEINLAECYSKGCLLQAAAALGANKMIGGYAERIGEKVMITLKLIDVRTESVERTEVGEFINEEREIQKMVQLVVQKLVGAEVDPIMENNLSFYNTYESMPTTKIINNGPRVGLAYFYGDTGDRLGAPLNEGGYDALPMMSQFGYQYEIQYMSAGNFQALIEGLAMVSGMENNMFIPSLIVMNGFRENKFGFEVGFGPSFSVRRMAQGYYDDQDAWHLTRDWQGIDAEGNMVPNPYPIQERLDSRGDAELFTRWVWTVGKTFRSGRLNIPVNAYFSPSGRNDFMVGGSIGFNIQKSRR